MAEAKASVSMNSVMTQRKKTVVLAAAIAAFQPAGLMLTEHFRGTRVEPVVVVCWALVMLALLAYVVMNMVKLKRLQRGAR